MTSRIPFRVHPMLATLVAKPFDRPGWIYEEKYDGDRIVAYKEGVRVRLLSRNAKDRTDRFPEIVAAIKGLPADRLVLDGEVVVFDAKGVSHFQALQDAKGTPVYAVFDCLYRDGVDLRAQPLSARQEAMRSVLNVNRALLPARRLAKDGLEAFRQAQHAGFEGLVAKELNSPYVEGRSSLWLKVKVHKEDEFIILGFTPPAGQREHFGALLLGAYDRDKLVYVGKVGAGFDRKRLAALAKMFRPLVTRNSPLVDPPPDRVVTFLKPRLVAQISYQELTAAKKLRQPVFLGLRDDKQARDVALPIAKDPMLARKTH